MDTRIEPAKSDYLMPATAARKLGITPRTLARMADSGQVESIVLPSGHRRYLSGSIDSFEHRKTA